MEELGRLHNVIKTKKEYSCRECFEIIKKGSPCYRQNVYSTAHFPMPTRVCITCGWKQIKEGKEVVKHGS